MPTETEMDEWVLRLKVTVCSLGPGVKTAIYLSIEVKSPVVRELDRRNRGHFGGVERKSITRTCPRIEIFRDGQNFLRRRRAATSAAFAPLLPAFPGNVDHQIRVSLGNVHMDSINGVQFH